MFEQIPFDSLSGPAARELADLFDRLARVLLAVASDRQQEEREREQRRRRRERLRNVFAQVEELRGAGRSLEEGILELAWQCGEPPEVVRAWYEVGAKLAGRIQRARRNREIARLARAGWTNREIAAGLKMHPKSVQKILRTALALGQDGLNHRAVRPPRKGAVSGPAATAQANAIRGPLPAYEAGSGNDGTV